MEFYHLRSFVAVAQTGNLTQAAKRLYTTPPAISAHIKTLEEELSTALFERSSKGMSLTEKGQMLLEKAQITLDSALDLVNLAATQQHEIIGTFRMGINLAPEQIRLNKLAENMLQNCPGISLDIRSLSTGFIIESLRSNELDGGYILGEIPSDLHGITVAKQKITTVAPKEFECNQIMTIPQLQSQQWIMMGDYCPFDEQLKNRLGENIPSVFKSADDGTRLQLVKSGLGISFLEWETALVAEKEQQVCIVSALDFYLDLSFVVPLKRLNDPLITAFLEEMKTLWNTVQQV